MYIVVKAKTKSKYFIINSATGKKVATVHCFDGSFARQMAATLNSNRTLDGNRK